MKNLNPYAAPESQDLREAPYARFVRCSHAATLAGAACAILITLATKSLLYGCAVVCASLMLQFLVAAVIAWLTETLSWPERGESMDVRTVAMPEPRHQSRYRTATSAGFIRHPVMFLITGIIGAHVALAIGYALTCALFGFEEPRW